MTRMPNSSSKVDVLVIGSGFGGLATALSLVERGATVRLCETVKYPGGCASTFTHQGYQFEAGATLFSGFGEGQLFAEWMERHQLEAEIEWLDPVVELRTPDHQLPISSDRENLIRRFLALPDAPQSAIQDFFDLQKRVADAVWGILDRPALLPPLTLRMLWGHMRRLPSYLPLVRLAGRPLRAVLRRFGLDHFAPLVTYLDALCQITLQCGVDEVEAPFALATMDYYFRGTGHVRGGVGELAWSLVRAVEAGGGEVSFADRVKRLERAGGDWRVVHRRGTTLAKTVVANLLPHTLTAMLPEDSGASEELTRIASQVEKGWGACMLYRVVRPPEEAASKARHLELVQDASRPLIEGNHLFCSISSADDPGRAPAPWRTMTVSTHVPMRTLEDLAVEDQGSYIDEIQERMRQGLKNLAPEWEHRQFEATASPRTFERFTGRKNGYVGGIPRRAGWHNYARLGPRRVLPGLYMIGDSVFPGQSTLATALGGVQLARAIVGER